MKNNLENSFISKFDLLNSQEDSEVIIWSSDCSDYENCINDENAKISKNICHKKRKRVVNKSKRSKNISQLDITFIESEQRNKSIIKLSPESSRKESPKIICKSPLLTSSQRHFVPCNLKHVDKSPIILSKTKSCSYKEKLDSPILSFKHISPINAPKVKKNLFNPKTERKDITCEERSKSPILKLSQKSKSITSKDTRQIQNSSKSLLRNIKNTDNRFNSLDNIQDNFPSLNSNLPLIEKVKSYFDSHFSSNTSQSASINESETESERNSSISIEDIEIINSQPELEPMVKTESKYSSNSLNYENDSQISKKARYKKDGLAFRLNALKKKQNANTSLWLHERFLAANSNFILPSEDFLIYRITNVNIKYGCHLIEVSDVNNEKYLIILNNIYIHKNNMKKNDVFKLYKPYNILECTDYKLIINPCKYECVVLKSNK